ncbi:Deformed epidermal autoregulatory factor 1 [Chionoecetes opilio]|uniref:Deformed epidermal autoregulatory factor 1 n=1 Tax=Chionoecetes opilio TaxID=41210 RepID=A0A8J4YWP5_CHIOP|nr:Deformed epidermal autoregulatory factor 1 [Chionoecetes opilio]
MPQQEASQIGQRENCATDATNILHEVPSTTVAATGPITTTTAITTTTTIITTATPNIKTTTNTTATTTTATTTLPDFKTTPSFHFEPDWREAAQEPVLLVRCKKTVAELHKNRFGSGSRGKCIKLSKEWFTPTEFEVHCGRSASKDWKRSISAITVPQRDTSTTRGRDRGPRARALNISAVDKCDQNMTSADFRTWCRSVEDWLTLNEVKDRQVCYIYLVCVPAVQKALDARLSHAEWDATSSAATLAAARIMQDVTPIDVIAATRAMVYFLSCGSCHPAGREPCPAWNAACRACGRVGHFQKACISTKKQRKTYAVTSTMIAEPP